MKSNESKLLILLASIVLGFLFTSQLNIVKFIPRQIMSLQSYQQMSSELRKINDEINLLNEKKRTLDLKLSDTQDSGQSESQTIEKLSEELNKYYYYVGLKDVEGPGLTISLSDRLGFGSDVETRETDSSWVVHDTDIVRLVWELKNAGAEAISINGNRIISTSEIYCGGPIIFVNRSKLVPPFIIRAVGNPDSLYFAINRDDSYYGFLESRELQISNKKESSIKVSKYDSNISTIYMKPVKE